MSDEHKPHDDHAHDAGQGPDQGHDEHAAPATGHDDASPAQDEAPAAESAAVDAAAHDDAVTSDEQDQDDHAPAEQAHAAAKAHEEPAIPAEAVAAAAVVGAAAVAATSADKPPVWSDAGDAPFEDVDATPVYARGKKGKKSKSSGGSAANEGWEIFKTIAVALLIALVLRIFLFQPFTIPSASMEPNLYEGDYIVVSKWSYGYSKHSIPLSPPIFEGRIFDTAPKRGDIVVFKLPRDDKTDYIKRLIGLPGDRVQMIDNVLHINGAPVRDVTITGEQLTTMYGQTITQADETLPGGKTFRIQDFGPGSDLDNTPVFEVPAGFYFMMGDNRDNSIDSRVDESAGVGLVPAENLIGKAEIILFSWSPGASLWNPVSWFSKIRPSRFFTVLN